FVAKHLIHKRNITYRTLPIFTSSSMGSGLFLFFAKYFVSVFFQMVTQLCHKPKTHGSTSRNFDKTTK
ncbi:MAG: hypothetical protein KUG81_10085, partial [Gammaproteobacteria bacterium]|nr:hypothetical protein [Gammaproteobacteria bacterium]